MKLLCLIVKSVIQWYLVYYLTIILFVWYIIVCVLSFIRANLHYDYLLVLLCEAILFWLSSIYSDYCCYLTVVWPIDYWCVYSSYCDYCHVLFYILSCYSEEVLLHSDIHYSSVSLIIEINQKWRWCRVMMIDVKYIIYSYSHTCLFALHLFYIVTLLWCSILMLHSMTLLIHTYGILLIHYLFWYILVNLYSILLTLFIPDLLFSYSCQCVWSQYNVCDDLSMVLSNYLRPCVILLFILFYYYSINVCVLLLLLSILSPGITTMTYRSDENGERNRKSMAMMIIDTLINPVVGRPMIQYWYYQAE